jgi:hypothetical protein
LKFKKGWGLKGFQPFLFLLGCFVNVKVKVNGKNLCDLGVSAVKHQWMVEFFFLPQRRRGRGEVFKGYGRSQMEDGDKRLRLR